MILVLIDYYLVAYLNIDYKEVHLNGLEES